MMPDHRTVLRRYRVALGAVIGGLVLSGVTAFPLLRELSLLSRALGIADPAWYADYTRLEHWIDCSFGVIGALPLLDCLRLTRRLEMISPLVHPDIP